MRIGIFETTHFEVAYTLIKFYDNGQNDLYIFVYPHAHRQLQFLLRDSYSKYTWILKEENVSKYGFMQLLYKKVKEHKIEYLFLDTIADNHLLYAWMISTLNRVRVIVTLHDINGYFFMKPGFSIRRWIRYIGKKFLIYTVKEFNVISSTMAGYLQEKLPPAKLVHSIPGAFFTEEEYMAPPDFTGTTIRIVVPGTVDVRRRNYTLVFELLDQCISLSIPVSLVLLGGYFGAAGKKIIDQCKAYPTGAITCYDTSLVDHPEFDRQMKQAHFIFNPSALETVLFDGVKERYGESISSGTIADCIHYARPAILPAALKTPQQLESSIVRYDTVSAMTVFLQELKNNPSLYHTLKEKAHTNSANFTLEKIREENKNLL